MRLTSIQIENFKNVEDSSPFRIDDVTCLVGKNESGKTALLEALYRVNPFEANRNMYDIEAEYPRRYLLDYKERHKGERATVATMTWSLDDADKAAVTDVLGPTCGLADTVTVSKTYEDTGRVCEVQVNEDAVVKHLIESAGLAVPEKAAASAATTIAALQEHLTSYLTTRGGEATPAETKLLTTLQMHFKRGSAAKAAIDILTPRLPKFVFFTQ